MKNPTKRGFTTAELIIVIAVIAILAAILIPTLSGVVDRADAKSALTDARNIAEQYVMDTFHNGKENPENVLISVKKDDAYFLFSYNAPNSELRISQENPFDVESFEELVEKYSYNSKHPGELPIDTTVYNTEEDGAFYLIPYDFNGENYVNNTGMRTVSVNREVAPTRGMLAASETIPGAEDDTYFYKLSGEDGLIKDSFGADGEVEAYHGILLGGTYDIDSHDDNDDDEPQTAKVTLSFSAGDLEGDPNVTLPSDIIVDKGQIIIPSQYKATYADNSYTFNCWYKNGSPCTSSFKITKDTTLTAKWDEIATCTITFKVGTGDSLNIATDRVSWIGQPNVTSTEFSGVLPEGTDITELLTYSDAIKEGTDFSGWYNNGVKYPNGSTVELTKNMTFTANFADSQVTVTYRAGEGTGTDVTNKVDKGSTITLPTADALGFIAPDGLQFDGWTTNFDSNKYAKGAEIDATTNMTFTAVWANNSFTVKYIASVPSKATSAGLSAKNIPEDKTYTVGTASVAIPANISLDWYNVAVSNGVVITSNKGASSVSMLGGTINTSHAQSGEIFTVTINFTPMSARFEYNNGGYTLVQTLPVAQTYDLIDCREGFTISNVRYTCSEHYKFGGWMYLITYRDGEEKMSGLSVLEPGDKFDVVSEHEEHTLDGATIQFMANFDEEQTDKEYKTVTLKYYDYQNYNYEQRSSSDATIGTITDVELEVGETYTLEDFYLSNVGSLFGSSSTVTGFDEYDITDASGNEFEGYYLIASNAELFGSFGGENKFTDISIASDYSDTTIYVPMYRVIDLYDEYYVVITNAVGFKNMDRGYVEMGGTLYSALSENFVLANNIAFTDSTYPIGFCRESDPYYTFDFEGKFDGFGYTITNFAFNSVYEYIGLFASNCGELRNFKMVVSNIINGSNYVGAVAGINDGNIKNVVVTLSGAKTLLQAYTTVGGICGAHNDGLIENCHVISTASYNSHIVALYADDADFSSTVTVTLTGAFLGGIAGGQDGGTIRRCSVGGGSTIVGIEATGGGTYNAHHIGGLVGLSTGLIDQCWAYKVTLNGDYTSGSNVPTYLQSVGGIVGTLYHGTLQHSWSRSIVLSVNMVGGGLAGMVTQQSTFTDCWAYFGGATYGDGYQMYIGDTVSVNAIASSCSYSSIITWDKYMGASLNTANYSSLANQNPSDVGLNGSYFETSANGPMLKNNPYATDWTVTQSYN